MGHAHRSKLAALGLLTLGVAFYLLFAIGELADGDSAGVQHLVPALVCAALLWVAIARPRPVGLTLLAISALGVLLAVLLFAGWSVSPAWALFVVVPAAAAGGLLLR